MCRIIGALYVRTVTCQCYSGPTMPLTSKIPAIALLALCAGPALAADFSDTALGYRLGRHYAEPFNPSHIGKNIVSLTHVRGGAYGSDYVNLDVLKSDRVDSHATEAYLLYRHTANLGKALGQGLGLTAGVDLNWKNDPGYGSKKRMLVLGPTLMLDAGGLLNVSLFALWESNRPVGVAERYHYRTHPMLNAVWALPVAGSGWSFEGYMNYIAAKGLDEFGVKTSPELNIDTQLMYDVSSSLGMKAGRVKAGFEYQYWRNKFGNPHRIPGSTAKTPMLRAEYHF